MATFDEHLERARTALDAAWIDPVRLEEMRKQSLLAITAAYGLTIPGAREMDSAELRRALDAAKPRMEL